MRNNDEDTLVDQIVTEGSNSPADVIFTENSPALEFLQNKGLLAKVDASTLAHTPAKYNSPDGDWVGVSARVSVLIYNTKLIAKSQLPTNVLQLADPRYKGKLAFAAGETDFQPIVTSVDRTYGEAATLKWLEGISSNASGHIYPDNETIADEVNRGAVAFGVVNQYYWYRMRAEIGPSNIDSAITYFAPRDPGYVLDVSGAAILKTSKHQVRGTAFLGLPRFQAGSDGHRSLDQFRVPDRLRRVDRSARDALRSSLNPTPSRFPNWATGQWRSPCSARPASSDGVPRQLGRRPPRSVPTSGPWCVPDDPARPGSCSAASTAIAAVLLTPFLFLVIQSRETGAGLVLGPIWRPLTARLLWNTASLTVTVTLLCAVLGTLTAWCVERTDLPGRRIWAVLLVVPFAIPDLVVSFGWVTLTTAVHGFPGRGLDHDPHVVPAGVPLRSSEPPQLRPGSGRRPCGASGSDVSGRSCV